MPKPRFADGVAIFASALYPKSALQKPNCGTNSDLSRGKHRLVELIVGSQQLDNKKTPVQIDNQLRTNTSIPGCCGISRFLCRNPLISLNFFIRDGYLLCFGAASILPVYKSSSTSSSRGVGFEGHWVRAMAISPTVNHSRTGDDWARKCSRAGEVQAYWCSRSRGAQTRCRSRRVWLLWGVWAGSRAFAARPPSPPSRR